MTQADVRAAIAYYQAIFEKVLSDDVKPLWESKFADLELADVTAAIDRLAVEREYPPNVMQVRAAALEGPRESAAAAWGRVLEEVERVGIYGEPTFPNERLERVVKVIGWDTICNADPYWMANRFADVYAAIRTDEREGYVSRRELEGAGMGQLVDGIGKEPE